MSVNILLRERRRKPVSRLLGGRWDKYSPCWCCWWWWWPAKDNSQWEALNNSISIMSNSSTGNNKSNNKNNNRSDNSSNSRSNNPCYNARNRSNSVISTSSSDSIITEQNLSIIETTSCRGSHYKRNALFNSVILTDHRTWPGHTLAANPRRRWCQGCALPGRMDADYSGSGDAAPNGREGDDGSQRDNRPSRHRLVLA